MLEYIDSDGVVLSQAEFRAGLGKGRVRQVLTGFEDSIVDQSQAADADLNVLVERWSRGHPMPVFEPGQFGNVAEMGDFQTVQDRLVVMKQAFLQLPAAVRERFKNSPVLFADALADVANHPEFEELGILAKREVVDERPVTLVPKAPTEEAGDKPA